MEYGIKGQFGQRGKNSQGVEGALTGSPIMDAPATVAVPLPMCRVRLGSVALQGTSLDDLNFSKSALALLG